MRFTIEHLEVFLLIMVRITGFIYTAPFFSVKNAPARIKIGISLFIAILLFPTVGMIEISYVGVIGYAMVVAKEAIVGLLMGLFSNMAYHIISFAGQMIDTEIGLSMVNSLDPTSNTSVTITSNYYGYMVMITMMLTNLHHHFIRALVDSFNVIPLSGAEISSEIYQLMIEYIIDFFMIGFRIILPVFATILIVNVILGILARVAPQMNMFVIGMQLKIFAGLAVMLLMVSLIPSVSDFIFNEMLEMLKKAITYMTPTS